MATDRLESITEMLLLGPGPSTVPDEISRALAHPTIGHMDPDFIALMDDLKSRLARMMHTTNEATIPISGTGSAGMETCFVNLIEPGARVLVLVNGVFGTRMVDVASRLGAEVETVEATWGEPIDLELVDTALEAGRFDLVAVVHAETSTGVRNPVPEIARQVADHGALFLVDGVTSFGGIPVELDAWNVDAFYTGSQKCLSVPPGLAPVSLSPRAVERIGRREQKVPNWYLDLSMLAQYWGGERRVYHHTAPINMLYALYRATTLFDDEGEQQVFDRHLAAHRQLVEGVERLGLEMLVEPQYRLPMLNAVRIPDGADDAKIRGRLRTEHRIEVGAGLGPLAGAIWRVGLMGNSARPEHVDRFLSALEAVL